MDRRRFVSMVAAGAIVPVLGSGARAQFAPVQAKPKVRNVVLVHGLFADGSCWSEVIGRLQSQGMRATSVQNPLTTLQAGVEATQRALAMQDGPTVLVAHSFSGMIATEAGVDPKVSALVYVAARAPDAGEDYTALAKRYPTPPASAGIVWSGDTDNSASRRSCATSPATCPRTKRASSTPCRRRSNARCWPTRQPCGLAIEADLVRGVDGGSHHQSRSRALHGKTHGRNDVRGESESSVVDFTARHDRKSDP